MFDVEKIKLFPKSAGVYIMKDEHETVLYVGKANNIAARLKQYFYGTDEREMVPLLTSQIKTIDTILVETEKEALLLENNLIKEFRPKYNVCLKDDKSYLSIAINHKHLWPMLRIVRFKGKPPSDAIYFGPYTKGHAARETLELLRRLFPLRQCSDRELVSRKRPCILFDLKRCIAPCVGKCTKEEYDREVKQVIAFLRGHNSEILKELEREMKEAIDSLEFEKAEAIYKTIQNIKFTLQKQRVQKIGEKDIDVIGFSRSIERVAIVILFFREGKLIGSSEHFFQVSLERDEEAITSFILQNYSDKDFYPNLILIPYAIEEANILSDLISERAKHKIEIIFPKMGDKKKLIEMAHKNAEAKLAREKEPKDVKEARLISLEEDLKLTNYPEWIECIDNSSIGGVDPVSSLVVFKRGSPDKSSYRKYKLNIENASDDYGALQEVLTRRFSKAKEEGNLPDLLIIDGGKGHLNIAIEVLRELDVSTVDLIALAKESSKHTRGLTLERIYQPNMDGPLLLKATSQTLLFLQAIRDEAHRFALAYQKKRRVKRTLASTLQELPGIGPIKRNRLLRTFGSLKKILEASEEELLAVKGITKKDVKTLLDLKHKSNY